MEAMTPAESRRWAATALSLIAAVLVACGSLALIARHLLMRTGKQIAYVAFDDGNREIYTIDPDALVYTPRRLTDHLGPDSDPVWSPDGKHLVFISSRSGQTDIYVMNADGSHVTQVTNDTAREWRPVWSPDGQVLAYQSQADGDFEIYTIPLNPPLCSVQPNACVGEPAQLTRNTVVDSYPIWSPDGNWIAFQSLRDGDFEVYVMDPEGTTQTRLTINPAHDWFPVWSPSSQYLAFESDRDGNREIYVLEVNRPYSAPARLTYHPALDSTPRWSPDSQHLAFVSNRTGNEEIFLVRLGPAESALTVNLTNSPAADRNPVWSADGRRLAFESYDGGEFGVFVINIDGSGRQQLTYHARSGHQLAWQP